MFSYNPVMNYYYDPSESIQTYVHQALQNAKYAIENACCCTDNYLYHYVIYHKSEILETKTLEEQIREQQKTLSDMLDAKNLGFPDLQSYYKFLQAKEYVTECESRMLKKSNEEPEIKYINENVIQISVAEIKK
jgi:hypothetical protein